MERKTNGFVGLAFTGENVENKHNCDEPNYIHKKCIQTSSQYASALSFFFRSSQKYQTVNGSAFYSFSLL